MPSTISAGTTAGSAIAIAGDTSGELQLRTNGTTAAVTIDTAQNTTFAKPINIGGATLGAGNATSFKNRIINGDMRIDQRNAGASVSITSPSSPYVLDRYSAHNVSNGVYSVQRSTTAPTGFTNSLICTTTTTDTSIASNQYAYIVQAIEGTNVQDLSWGTANAKTITLSFWVRSSLTGTFTGSVKNGGATRSYPFTYTINSANTWEKESITIPGDTTGTWATDNTSGIVLVLALAVGSSSSGTAFAWGNGNFGGTTSQVNVLGTLNATFYVTGIQIEEGTQATSFDYRPIGTELALCQRYFERIDNNTLGLWVSSTALRVYPKYQVKKRGSTTITLSTTTPYAEQIGIVALNGSGSTIINNAPGAADGGDVQVDGFTGRSYGEWAFLGISVLLVSSEIG